MRCSATASSRRSICFASRRRGFRPNHENCDRRIHAREGAGLDRRQTRHLGYGNCGGSVRARRARRHRQSGLLPSCRRRLDLAPASLRWGGRQLAFEGRPIERLILAQRPNAQLEADPRPHGELIGAIRRRREDGDPPPRRASRRRRGMRRPCVDGGHRTKGRERPLPFTVASPASSASLLRDLPLQDRPVRKETPRETRLDGDLPPLPGSSMRIPVRTFDAWRRPRQ